MGNSNPERKHHIYLSGLTQDNAEFLPIIADGDDTDFRNLEVPEILPVLPLRNTVLFPGVVIPITVGRQKSLKLIHDVYKGSRLLGTLAQRDCTLDDPSPADLYSLGTVAEVMKILEMPDGSTTVIIQGKRRFRIRQFVADDPYFKAEIELLSDIVPSDSNEFAAIVGSLKDLSIRIAHFSANVPPEATFAVKNIENSTFLINFISSNTDIGVAEKQKLLEFDHLRDRGFQADRKSVV